MARLVLFDIDNTLLWTGGAGTLAMARAFADLYGVEDAFRNVEFSGRTDTAIVIDALRQHARLDGDLPAQVRRFRERYVLHLADTLREATGGCVLPGIRELLAGLQGCDHVRLGLATGNFRGGAEMKLDHYGVRRFFQTGGFGDDSEDRAQVVGIAIERTGGEGFTGPVVVIGDTPHDVRAAKANGAFALALATGRYPAEDLRSVGADAVFESGADAGVLPTILSA